MITDRIDNVVHIPEAWRSAFPPPPHAVKIELMRTCNYHCAFCSHDRLDKREGRMDWPLYEKILRECRVLGVEEIAPFFFGESFLDVRLPEAIRLARGLGFPYIFLTTNGSAATPSKVMDCMEAGLNSLKFSLNACDAEQFAAVTGADPRLFNVVKENIKMARKVRDAGAYKCGLYASYIKFDGEQGEKMKLVMEELAPYLDEVYALPLYNQSGTVAVNEWEFSGGNTARFDNPVPPVPCWALFREAHVNFDGTVCACSFSVSDDFIMGDLNHQSFMEVWHSAKFASLRQAHLDKAISGTPCYKCLVCE